MTNVFNVQLIADSIKNTFVLQREENEKLLEKFEEELKELNGDVEPLLDSMGRYHAPINGYSHSDGTVYRKGQFIPHEDYTGGRGIQTVKISLKGEDFINDVLANEYLKDSVGKRWTDKSNVLCCNLYADIASGFSEQVEQVVELVASQYEIKEVPHDLDGKVSVEGTIDGFWSRNTMYGTQFGMDIRMESGAVYSGTQPSALGSKIDAKVGDVISFTANFKEGSKSFKRPSKVKMVRVSEDTSEI